MKNQEQRRGYDIFNMGFGLLMFGYFTVVMFAANG